jgi:hypothetical protein
MLYAWHEWDFDTKKDTRLEIENETALLMRRKRERVYEKRAF